MQTGQSRRVKNHFSLLPPRPTYSDGHKKPLLLRLSLTSRNYGAKKKTFEMISPALIKNHSSFCAPVFPRMHIIPTTTYILHEEDFSLPGRCLRRIVCVAGWWPVWKGGGLTCLGKRREGGGGGGGGGGGVGGGGEIGERVASKLLLLLRRRLRIGMRLRRRRRRKKGEERKGGKGQSWALPNMDGELLE